jgi:hypothetical protein
MIGALRLLRVDEKVDKLPYSFPGGVDFGKPGYISK